MALFRRIIRYLFSSVFLGIVTVVGVPVVVVLTVFAGLVFLPLPATIPIPKAAVTVEPTTIYDRNGAVIATLQQYDQSVPVAEASIPTVLKEAVISDEDKNFYKQGGVDIRGTIRAAIADIRSNRVVQGGSTITQQYVKLAFTGGKRNILRKIREAILASQLDRQASKDEILYRYLTTVYFGDGNYGIGAAAKNYFHLDVSQLNASQAATIAGLIPAPSDRAPREHLALAEQYRELVLGKMLQQGYLTQDSYDHAMASKLAESGAAAPAGATIVYPQATSATAYPDFVSYVTSWLKQRYPDSMVFGGGLRVQTTLDPTKEQEAFAAVNTTLAGTSDPLEMGLASVEPQTGFIQALVGGRQTGRNPKYAQDDFALGGCDPPKLPSADFVVPATCFQSPVVGGGGAGRQPGSAWKPFVLATAFEQGIQPTAEFPAPSQLAIPGCIKSPSNSCTISNDEGGYAGGSQTLATAIAQSTNTVYAQLAAKVGCANIAKTAKALGITSAFYAPVFQPYCQTYALGIVDVSPLDMASAYGVFANHGLRAEPTPILEILDGSGKTLVDNISHAPATTRVLPANIADNVTNLLQGVIADGTGTKAQLGRPAAGKTGTTSNYTNAWFVGYTPTLSTAVWMGNVSSESISLGAVRDNRGGGTVDPVYGGTLPAETWKQFMNAALASVPATPFTAPAPIIPAAQAISATTTTVAAVAPGRQTPVINTPAGGPYVNGSGPASAPYPESPNPSPTTVPSSTTTTVPFGAGTGDGSTTTTSTPAG